MHFGIHTGQQQRVNTVLRGPIDLEGLQLFMEEVVPAFRSVDERRD